MGPLGQHTIVKKVNAQSLGFGGQNHDLTHREQDYFVCGNQILMTRTFKLVNSRGGVVSLNGGHWVFSLSFQEL